MIINLIRYERNGDGSTYARAPFAWDTDKGDLNASSASRYGGGYEFVGTDTLEGGLSLTLRFTDVYEVDTFMDIAQAAYKDVDLNDAQVVRWGRFMDSLAALIAVAPKFGETKVYEHPRPITWDQYAHERSYHADIDARRDGDSS